MQKDIAKFFKPQYISTMKLKSLILLLSLLSLRALGIGGCTLSWQGDDLFFSRGGSVFVQLSNGSTYSVNKQNYVSGTQYALDSDSKVHAYRPSYETTCYPETWGYVILCACDSHGGMLCAPGTTQTLASGTLYEIYQSYLICGCPNGSSYGGLGEFTIVHCN